MAEERFGRRPGKPGKPGAGRKAGRPSGSFSRGGGTRGQGGGGRVGQSSGGSRRAGSVHGRFDRVQPTAYGDGKGARPERRGVDRQGGRSDSGSRSLLDEVRATARPGQADRAVKAFEDALEALDRGRPAAAAARAEEAKELSPRSGAVRELLGISLYQTERYREALRELQAYRRMTGRADQNHLIADSQRALGAPEKAVEPAREAIRIRAVPEEARAEAAVVGAAALADLARFDEALSLLRSFVSRQRGKDQAARPFDLRLWYVAGDILERAGRKREAAAEFRKVVRHDAAAFDAAERLARLGG
jgi:tetratricopeptide (TPR) repeat protein